MKTRLLIYAVEGIIAFILLSYNLHLFLFVAFIYLSIKIDADADYLRKIIRVFQVANEVKTNAILKKLKISQEDVTTADKEYSDTLTEEQFKSLKKDMREIS